MSSVGVFRKAEIDGKSFLVHTLRQADEPTSSREVLAMDSHGDDLPLFLCPTVRVEFHILNLRKDDDGNEFDELHPYTCLPHFPSKGESLHDCDDDYHIISSCKLPVVPLFPSSDDKEPEYYRSKCGACGSKNMLCADYYVCRYCYQKFHKECVESPLEIIHPSHPFHPLRLYSCPFTNKKGGFLWFPTCICCEVSLSQMFYHCTACNFSMHPICAMKPVPFVVHHPKSHPHPLTFFPTQASTVCHICASIKEFDPTYICIQCVFVIHEGCMGFPHVIRISRHHHRISFTSSLPPGMLLSCGVCRQQVDNNYAAYSCNKCDAYFVHSKCALHPMVWDGKELEGVPEEDDEIDDGEPFQRIAEGIIRHPFHKHHLRLEIFRAYDENIYCGGCSLPIYQGQFYLCMECNFILHESCANAPRMKRHPLYPMPLTLKFTRMKDLFNPGGIIRCTGCQRFVSGFYYDALSSIKGSIKLDLRCASTVEPVRYPGHKHDLFMPWDQHEGTQCQACKEECEDSKFVCMECDYTICFRCITVPYWVRYKHDSHWLTLCDEEEPSDQPDWCEICEGKIEEGTKIFEEGNLEEKTLIWDRKKPKSERRFYKCSSDCCTNLHVECLVGVDVYMKSGKIVKDGVAFLPGFHRQSRSFRKNMDVQIRLNGSLSRPICDQCYCRCPFPIYFIGHDRTFCSWRCTQNARYW
ncbi:hypothetical protein CARUB_v10028263mg [Capsella rubella]|uniref:Phorbol-ester/DAG-type domain-containing protein n=1 Tax=Capsella rubella TaxID=81985 RepID=R0F028_9BRAS|nr:uncharacterized protein LOC17876341 [Capsella rubella]EOA14922.1 hypothetical protein CARUB_v10028263mg [Capsella rubella]